MEHTAPPVGRTTNFSRAEAGPLASWDAHVFTRPGTGEQVKGKLFLKDLLGLSGMEVSLNKLPPRTFVPFNHRHRLNEEVYVFVKGRGRFMVDGVAVPVREGTVIRVSPEGSRTWRNDSDEDLYYVVVQARAGSMDFGATEDGVHLEGRPRWRKAPGGDHETA